MQSLCSLAVSATRGARSSLTRSAAALAQRSSLVAAASPAVAMPALARANSSLPIIEDYVRRSYPFPTILESSLPPDYSRWLWYHNQHPHDVPNHKSRLTVDIRDLGLDATSRMVLREIVGNRYDARTHQITFVSRSLVSPQANENRVFQMLDAALVECRAIARKMNADGFYARENGSAGEADRLLRPVPDKASVIRSKMTRRRQLIQAEKAKEAQRAKVLAGTPLAPKIEEATAAKAAGVPSGLTQRKRNMLAVGMDNTKKKQLQSGDNKNAEAAAATPSDPTATPAAAQPASA